MHERSVLVDRNRIEANDRGEAESIAYLLSHWLDCVV